MNASWVRIPELLDASGSRIAELCEAPAARIVPGASAAIALGVAACIAGRNGDLGERLPEVSGAARGLVMQRGHRYKYARCALLAGAKLIEVGSEGHTSAKELADALDGSVAAILHPAHLDGVDGSLPLADVAEVAGKVGIPVVVDAAYLSYPTELISSFMTAGADLVCFSAKYFHGPNAGGFLLGREDLVEAVRDNDFTGYESGEHLTFGRPFKLDRITIVATQLALENWLTMDHEARWEAYAARVEEMQNQLADVPGLTSAARQFTLDERVIEGDVNALAVSLERLDPDSAAAELAAGEPPIICVPVADQLIFAVETIDPSEDHLIVERLKSVSGGGR
ncbi:MAG: aminotransferase class V-fold PLP-dependent enzyme [Actinobacteria bacterium]|nr:aminotransferase class V-fold PLP-dependent enzyme [Actinomycetota bacterium]